MFSITPLTFDDPSRLYIVVMFTINMQLPTVRFEPRSSHTAVRHVMMLPLDHCDLHSTGDGSIFIQTRTDVDCNP